MLVLLVSATWATALVYLGARANLPAPIRLAVVDAVHVYVGLASLIFIGAKVIRVGLRRHVTGVPPSALWHRWLSWSLVVLYAAVYLTGGLLLFGWGQGVRTTLANAHLLASVWAAVPTTWHVWHYRRLAFPSRSWPAPARWWRRLAAGLGIVLIPNLAFVLVPRDLSPLASAGLGSSWTQAALPGVFLDKLAATPDGRFFVAGGAGVYVKARPDGAWRRVALPSGDGREPVVLGLATAAGPEAVYVGTSRGLFASSNPNGPYRPVPFPSHEIHGIAVDSRDPRIVWASSRGGVFRSADSGQSWTSASQGIPAPETAFGLSYFRESLYASDGTGVYRWTGIAWEPAVHQEAVYGFDVAPTGDRLYSSSMGDGIRVFDGSRWTESDAGFRSHNGGVHVVTINQVSPARAYAATMEGAGVSTDGGRSWLAFAAGLPPGGIWRVLPDGPDHLVAATEHGIYRYSLNTDEPPGSGWWLTLLGVVSGTGVIAVGVVALPSRAGVRRRSAPVKASRPSPR